MKTLDKDAFSDLQTATCTKAAQLFEEAMQRIVNEVKIVTTEITNLYGAANHRADGDGLNYTDDAMPEKTKSLVKLKQEKEERKLMKQRAKMEYTTLPEYIRFVDYLTVETLVTITINIVTQFYEALTAVRNKSGVFETMVRFNEAGTTFSPTANEIKEVLDKLLDTIINTVGQVNRVTYNSQSKSAASGPNIQAIIKENRQFRLMAANLRNKVTSDFEKAEEHAVTYKSVRPIYTFNLTWNLEQYRTQHHDVSDFKKRMESFADWTKELDKLRNRPIGILEVDSKRLKAELNPIVEARLLEVKNFVKEKARERCVNLLAHFKDCLNKLSNRPIHLKDYAAFVQVISAMREEEKNLFKRTSQVDQLYN